MENKVIIREYQSADKVSVLKLLRLNTPKYFSSAEEKDFINYLENEIEHYYLLNLDGEIVGCGGFNFSGDSSHGKISWDIIHPNHQGKSLGTMLLKYRIEKLNEFESLQKITVRTSQLAYKFYEKSGFKLLEIIKDYWSKGYDLYRMEYERDKK